MDKHTAGPWTLESLTTKAGRAKYGLCGSNHRICDISVYDDRDEANARLIAAAPDLLAALRELVNRCDGAEGVRADESNIQTMQAHAVLAKLEAE